MRLVSAMLAMVVWGSPCAEGPAGQQDAPAARRQQASVGKPGGPLEHSPGQHTIIQGQANYATCISNVTGATAIAMTCMAVAATHVPAGGVAGLLIGAGSGRFLIGPLVCTPDPAH